MTDLVVTPASVLYVEGPLELGCVAGAAFATGDMVALDSDNTWKGARNSSTVDLAGATKYGMALFTAAAVGARGAVALDGAQVTVGSIVTAGLVYYLSTNAGKIAPVADLISTNKVVPCCLSVSATKVKVIRVYDAGSVKP